METSITELDQIKLTLDYWKIALSVLSLLLTLLLAWLGYKLAFKNWMEQKKEEVKLRKQQLQYDARLDAHKAAWGLLAYLSEKENDKTVFVDRGTREESYYMLRKEQARDFLKALPKVFFEDGHGLFLSKEVKKDLYDFRSRVYRLLEKEHHTNPSEASSIKVTNEDVKKEVTAIRERLKTALKNNIDIT